jgi:hypothetical protein
MTKKETSKYSDLIRNNKIKIPLPNLDKLKAAVDKDIKKLDKKIESCLNKIDDVEEYKVWIGRAADFSIIKSRLKKIVKDFPTIVKEIERIWTNPMKLDIEDELIEDELRMAEPFYSIEFSNGWEDFNQVGSKCDVFGFVQSDLFGFVQKTMHNTLEYFGKFGTLICLAGSDAVILETNSCHPWLEEIYKQTKTDTN